VSKVPEDRNYFDTFTGNLENLLEDITKSVILIITIISKVLLILGSILDLGLAPWLMSIILNK
jgi:hypothetical protein